MGHHQIVRCIGHGNVKFVAFCRMGVFPNRIAFAVVVMPFADNAFGQVGLGIFAVGGGGRAACCEKEGDQAGQ